MILCMSKFMYAVMILTLLMAVLPSSRNSIQANEPGGACVSVPTPDNSFDQTSSCSYPVQASICGESNIAYTKTFHANKTCADVGFPANCHGSMLNMKTQADCKAARDKLG